ncbi:hypothetical protein VNO77_22712 [Canavalia gladiata]|uniref:Uncharacterized protein n=1 Tax=Canavalia gladiata TaxID=3824 RepID=A0AAN9L337_CANGL
MRGFMYIGRVRGGGGARTLVKLSALWTNMISHYARTCPEAYSVHGVSLFHEIHVLHAYMYSPKYLRAIFIHHCDHRARGKLLNAQGSRSKICMTLHALYKERS